MDKMQRTNLIWDKYIDYLIDAIDGGKFITRAEDKPMATPKKPTESHISTRARHLSQSANIAKSIAKGLGLNENFIYAAMLMHDAGHPFSAHEGEEIFSQLGDVFNTPYFHHNAKGVEIIMSEDICGKAINNIPNIENNPELRKQLEKEFQYFLDVIISHDGEATKKDMMKEETHYDSIQEAVRTKMSQANGINNYKFIAQTPEGKIAKFADVIAYLTSDMRDGFRLGIIKDFDNEYLELFGTMFSTKGSSAISEQEKIECGKKIIEQIKEQSLSEIKEDFINNQDDNMRETLREALLEIKTEIKNRGLNIHDESNIDKIQKIIKQEQDKFKENKLNEFFKAKGENVTEKQIKNLAKEISRKSKKGEKLDKNERELIKKLNETISNANKIYTYAMKMLKTSLDTVDTIANKMKEYFKEDLLNNSKDKNTPQFSDTTWDLFIKAKILNYNKYVQYTNWTYQTKELPKAAKALVEKGAKSLVKSGAIIDKFSDNDARKYVQDKEALEYMKKYVENRERNEKAEKLYRKKMKIRDYAKPTKGKFTDKIQQLKKLKKLKDLYNNLDSYVQNKNEVFAINYENTFKAIKTRVRRKIETALTDEHKVDEKHLYRENVQKQVDSYRQKILNTYGTTNITKEQKEEFINEEIQTELNNMEYKMAVQLSSDYLAGMSDETFIDLAIGTGHLSKEAVDKAKRGTIPSDSVRKLSSEIEAEKNRDNKDDGEER